MDEEPTATHPRSAASGRRRLAELDLLNGAFDLSYDRLSALACDLLSAPSGAVSVIDDQADRQFFKSFFGLPHEVAATRSTPLSQSLCKTVRATGASLSITDARKDPRFRDHPACRDLGIVAYLGHPIHLPSGEPIGALCVFDSKPRDWSEADKRRLNVLAGCVNESIRRLDAAQQAETAQRSAARAHGARELFLAGLNHEIRTALNGVLGAATVLEALPLDAEAKSLVEMIGDSGTALSGLLETLLSQTEAATLMPQGGLSQSLRGVLAEVFGVLRFTPLGRAHRFTLELTGEETALGDADARRIKQLAYDLLGSAVIAAPGGKTEIRVAIIGNSAATLQATLNADPQVDGDLRKTLAELDFRHVCNLAIAARGGFEIVTLEPRRAVLEIRLPLGPAAQGDAGASTP